MNTRKAQQGIRKSLAYWRKRLNVSNQWQIGVHLYLEPGTDRSDEDQEQLAAIEATDYFHADLTINAYNFDWERLDEIICHEVLHLVCRPMEQVVDRALKRQPEVATAMQEQLIETLTAALLWK